MDLVVTTLAAIESAVEKQGNQGGGFRPHLGASIIGDPCERKLWYSFRWVTRQNHDARLLRLFARGQREEQTFIDLLRLAGIEVFDRDPKTGKQFTFSAIGGHFGGSMDAVVRGLVESNKWHVAEFKTSNAKSFRDLADKGVEMSKPLHYAQMQCYMTWGNMDAAYYMAVNKDDDTIHAERITLKKTVANSLFEKAERIIASDKPPAGISDNGTYYLCKFCEHSDTCHGEKVAEVNCRTCIHATPEMDGQGRWSCAKHKKDLSVDDQAKACDRHRFIPALIPFAEAINADDKGETITYQTAKGSIFHNGPKGVCSYPSLELRNVTPDLVADKNVNQLRQQYDAWTVAP